MDSGLGSGGVPYEYVIPEKKTKSLIVKRIVLISFYVLWAAGLLVFGVMLRIVAPLLAFIPLSLWILVFFTWRRTQVEYEQSYFAGTLTVSRILGGKSRKKLCEVKIRDLSAVFPYEGGNVDKAEDYRPEKLIYAASSMESPDLYCAMWKDETSGKRVLLWFDATEKGLRLLRYYNAPAVTVKKVSR